jgi:hypothetical protein
MRDPTNLKRVRTGTLEIAYEESGPSDGAAVLLMHGFPYDVAHMMRWRCGSQARSAV